MRRVTEVEASRLLDEPVPEHEWQKYVTKDSLLLFVYVLGVILVGTTNRVTFKVPLVASRCTDVLS
jgi:hypothetical protein